MQNGKPVFGVCHWPGVDVVLNSLSHDNYIGRSLSLLKTNGRFMDRGQRQNRTSTPRLTARSILMLLISALSVFVANKEIGKRGIWTHAQMSTERPDVQYTCIAADTMMETEPWRRAPWAFTKWHQREFISLLILNFRNKFAAAEF
eukprot:2064771-Amphidinium_carterae.1